MSTSLKRKFLLPILAGAALLILSAAIITQLGLLPELRSQLHKRAELMLTTIRAASKINPGYQDLRFALEEITLKTSGVYGITLATLDPTIIWASSTHPDADLDQHTADMLELLDSSAEQHIFGDFIHRNGDVIVIAPLKRLTDTPPQPKSFEQLILPKDVNISSAFSLEPDSYEGILYLRFNWAEAEALANNALLNHMFAISAAILLMLALATTTLYKVILRPLSLISKTIHAQKSGALDSRTQKLPDDEIGLLGSSINEMLDDLHNRDRLLKSVVNHLPVGLSLKGIDGRKIIQNDAYRTSYLSPYVDGKIREDLLNKRVDLQHRVISEAIPVSHEELLNLNNRERHFETTIFPIFNTHDEIEWLGTLCFEITEKKEREQQLTQLYKAVEAVKSGIVICKYDAPNYPIIYINPAVTKLTGYSAAELIGKSPNIFSQSAENSSALEEIRKAIVDQETCSVVLRNKRKDGSYFWNEFTLSIITTTDGEATHLVGVQNDVSERIEAANKIEHMAFFDPLTDLPNRILFNDRLSQIIAEAQREHTHAAVMYIDLDGFKAANDSFGHNTGDQLLKDASSRMKLCIREQDSIARMGGDEFTILIPGLNPEQVIVNLPKVVDRILKQLNTPFDIFNNQVHISGSIGISIYPKDGRTPEELLINADHAMYHAKESGKNSFRFFQLEMNQAIEQQQKIEFSLREAVRDKAFNLHYQPQVSCHSHNLSIEALIRCNHPAIKHLSPATFIPVAEQTGLIDEIGTWVIEQACSDMAEFQRDGSKINKIAINISPQQFRRQNIAQIIHKNIKRFNLPTDSLEVEITENVIIDDYQAALSILNELRLLGVTIAIDDFGTGYSSLTYLKQLPIDTLKIDKQFIEGLPHDEEGGHIVKAISGLAHGMNMQLLAEGVETEEQVAFVKDELNCDQIQGYYFSKPLSKQDLIASEFY
ncbi:EAL domain-containing protein [Neptuniibacter sp. QD72_48]|uniref:EAL domain-containing protein n=1 Tax=unclassified Neptuniibacter TaxID=2630693 RepID=UPI0039F65C5F